MRASAGKVQASRESLLAANRVQRLLELKEQQHALAEKQRRLQEAKDDHDAQYSAKFKAVPTASPIASELSRFQAAKGATPRLTRFAQGQRTNDAKENSKYLQYVKMVLPEGCRPMSAVPVASATHARLEWSQSNRQKAADERHLQEVHEMQREAERRELHAKVMLNRSASYGKVAAARDDVLEANRESRRREKLEQLHAKAEKERRLQAAKDDHDAAYAAKFKPIAPTGWAAHEALRFGAVGGPALRSSR